MAVNTTPLVRFRGPEAGGGAAFERHVDSDVAGTQGGRYKVTAGDNGGSALQLREAIVLDANNNRRFDTGETVLGDDTSSPNPVNGDLLIGFLPETRHIGVVATSGIAPSGDNVTIGPVATTGTKTDFNRNNVILETGLGGANRVVSWENDAPIDTLADIGAIDAVQTVGVPYTGPDAIADNDWILVDAEQMRVTDINTGANTLTVVRGRNLTTAAAHAAGAAISRLQPSLTQEESATAANGPVVIKFAANVNRGNADFDVQYPGQVLDGGSRNDVIGPATGADAGCETGTAGPNVPDGHYHRAGTIARMCVGATDADADGVCATSAFVGDLHDPNDGNNNSDGDAVGDRNDNCISVANSPAAGFTQPDKDQDGVGDACDTFHDSDGDGFSDRLEGATSVANDASSPGLGAEEGTFCDNTVDDDADATVNDGCPRAGPPEVACADAADSDTDTFMNDGCPAVNPGGANPAVPAGTYMMVHCARGVLLAGGVAGNAYPVDTNGDNFVDITDIGDFAANFGQATESNGGTAPDRFDIAPDGPGVGLGGGTGDGFVDITDKGEASGRFGTSPC